ncbi:hypothetical protein Ate01nite_69070 [Actinoplanes teichomyceticus]|nr:hypothetical protein Ate01nite_69070 [Actinoplanes teichomyceticus]
MDALHRRIVNPRFHDSFETAPLTDRGSYVDGNAAPNAAFNGPSAVPLPRSDAGRYASMDARCGARAGP